MTKTTPTTQRARSKEYPSKTIKECIDFITKLKNYPHKKPISYINAAKELNLSTKSNSFKYIISASRQYGLIYTASSGQTLTVTELGYNIIYPNNNDISEAIFTCFKTPQLYQALIQDYDGKSAPTKSILEGVMVTNCGIAPTVAGLAADVFLENASYAGAIESGIIYGQFTNTNFTSNTHTHTPFHQKSTDIPNPTNITTINNTITNEDSFSEQIHNKQEIKITLKGNRTVVFSYPDDLNNKEADKVMKTIELFLEEILKHTNEDKINNK